MGNDVGKLLLTATYFGHNAATPERWHKRSPSMLEAVLPVKLRVEPSA